MINHLDPLRPYFLGAPWKIPIVCDLSSGLGDLSSCLGLNLEA